MRIFSSIILSVALASGSIAAEAIVTDGDTLVLEGKAYRLDGIDAPETDQMCIDKNGSLWTCGLEARVQLRKHVERRDVQCPGRSPDPVYRNRRVSMCTAAGEDVSLNEWMVRQGWALNSEPYAKGRFKNAEDEARAAQRGLWSGCFASPQVHRRSSWDAVLLGSGCERVSQDEARRMLFPDDPRMPPGCPIKGKLATRAHFTGHRGIYHLKHCGSWRRLKKPDRWFCSETEAQAEGFRRAFNCSRPQAS